MQQQTNNLAQAQTTFGAKPGGVTAALSRVCCKLAAHGRVDRFKKPIGVLLSKFVAN